MYLSRMEKAVSKSVVASLLARSDDAFHVAVLKAYMGTFEFRDDPMDMAIRKLLMEAELPKETQQIDRVIQAFAERYHECNPDIYISPEQAYFIAFSLLILHTDVFNKNNRHKMQKADYVKNSQGEGVTNDILECFYSNITYTPFIHVEDDFDINGEKIVPQKPKRGLFGRVSTDSKRNISNKEPVDPYALIMEHRLDILRPSLKDVLEVEDPYSYLGTANKLDISGLHKSFFRYAVLQIVSPRSRPDAFMSPKTVANPQDADPGLVDIKVTKVGILWRKDTKKKKMRDPWQEWGAMLTGSQLYFFRNVSWIKNLMGQLEQHQKAGNTETAVIFTPPLNHFKPDALVSTDDAVALLDNSYKKHKYAFAFIRHGGVQEYFLAESEGEMNDWLAKLNYAATFRTAGVRMRGVVGGNYEGQRVRVIRRMGNPSGAHVVDSPSGEVSILKGGIDHQLAAEISNARRQIVQQKILDSEERLEAASKQLDAYLRNARHLSILTPVQGKTREQVVLAAGALAAKLQWVRIDMWKLKCHRDILALDMEEEKRTMNEQARKSAMFSTPRRSSKTSTHSRTQEGPATTAELLAPSQADCGIAPHSPVDSVPALDLPDATAEDSWDMPFLPAERKPRSSISSATQRPASASSLAPPINEATNGADSHSIGTSFSNHSANRSEEELEFEIEKGSENDKVKKESGSIPKLRRGLQKTLREAHVPGHRSKKSKDFSSELKDGADKNGETQEEGLARGSGSFTLHGKKASVITFGSEWQSLPPEERFKRHKVSLTPDPNGGNFAGLSRQNSEVKSEGRFEAKLEYTTEPLSVGRSSQQEEKLDVTHSTNNEA
ncbi:hypothetical protein BDZ91DRAFT_657865 [Kalaharituber pfeilii]|nr:hypothetical protein BDZ91DRAFT_657865 [Kalaharituber pfeilii]